MEVIKENFKAILPKFEEHLNKAKLVSIDVELTGIWTNELTKTFVFDSMDLKYRKLKAMAEKFQIIQVGVCLYEWVEDPVEDPSSNSKINFPLAEEPYLDEGSFDDFEGSSKELIVSECNQKRKRSSLHSSQDRESDIPNFHLKPKLAKTTGHYEARPYNFYVYPSQQVGIFKQEKVFSVCNSSIDFLSESGFDFNKWIYQGIPYINNADIEGLKKEKAKLVSNNNTKISVSEDQLEFYSSVKIKLEMLNQSEFGESISIPTTNTYQMRLVHQQANLYPLLISEGQYGNEVTVTKMLEGDINKLVDAKIQIIHDKTESSKGFTKVIQLLANYKKPIVAHNCMADLVFIYSNFYGILPETLSEFKIKLHQIFPIIYDTKFILDDASALNKKYDSSVLNKINKTLSDDQYKAPIIKLNPMHNKYSTEKLHEAGYDAFISGRVFLKLTPELAKQPNIGYANKVFMFKSIPSYLNLTGLDDESNLPSAVYLESAKGDLDYLAVESFISTLIQKDDLLIYRISSLSCLISVENTSAHLIPEIISLINLNKEYDWSAKAYSEETFT